MWHVSSQTVVEYKEHTRHVFHIAIPEITGNHRVAEDMPLECPAQNGQTSIQFDFEKLL